MCTLRRALRLACTIQSFSRSEVMSCIAAQGVLIVGGSGVVGRRIAAALAPDYGDQVIVARVNLDRAMIAATEIGREVRFREVDVKAPSSIAAAPEDVAIVVSCIDQPRRDVLRAAIERGLRYTDITPHLTELGRGTVFESIDAAARKSGARVVLGAGLVPGISNVMRGCRRAGRSRSDRDIPTAFGARCSGSGLVRFFSPGAVNALRRARGRRGQAGARL
jgi:NAD(P)-dependent dehydrogenase (short-subunit alcohol dehydrogenase family)